MVGGRAGVDLSACSVLSVALPEPTGHLSSALAHHPGVSQWQEGWEQGVTERSVQTVGPPRKAGWPVTAVLEGVLGAWTGLPCCGWEVLLPRGPELHAAGKRFRVVAEL